MDVTNTNAAAFQGQLNQSYALNATAACVSPYNQPNEPAPQPFTIDVAERVGTLEMMIGDARSELSMLAERLFGPQPVASAGSTAPSVPLGQAGELAAMLHRLIACANDVRDTARRLNSRI